MVDYIIVVFDFFISFSFCFPVSLPGTIVIFCPAAIGAHLCHVTDDESSTHSAKIQNVSESTGRNVNNAKWNNIIDIMKPLV